MDSETTEAELLAECYEWLVDNPGAERLPYYLFERLTQSGVNALKAEARLLVQRTRES